MEYIFTEKKKVGHIVGIFGAVFALTLGQTATSHAGIVNSENATSAIGTLAGVAAGAAFGGAVVGGFAGPPGAAVVSVGAVSGAVVGAITYTAVTQSIKNPVVAVKTLQSLNPVSGPVYMATHPTQTVNAVKSFWNYLFN